MSLSTSQYPGISLPSSPESGDGEPPSSPTIGSIVTEKPNVSGADDREGCKCKKGCNTSQCACRKVGASCSISCACMDGWAFCRARRALPCSSPFASLSQIFGGIKTKELAEATRGGTQYGAGFWLHNSQLEVITTHTANACFSKYLNGKDGLVDVEDLKAKLSAPCEAFEIDVHMAAWRAMFKSMQKKGFGEPELHKHFHVLFHYGLSENYSEYIKVEVNKDLESLHIWSFCRGGWVDRESVSHCWTCNSCYDDAWHCDTCGVCKVGRKFACDGCGGWSEIGIFEGTSAGRAVTAGRGQGRGKGRAEKRKRESMQDGSHAAARAIP
ncbi:hypothetical protein AC578_5950 [Pseudocercospora eumusae]|uniref:Tesmin/TSO1-like CXC domain-containing protein n=1 Tax=Pseudocercospora eumusae TaxID=321146 RepID=A0A139HI46_9PEZI|nr:hypothetical protein AC578_5950 [Pseudocercospora eumusae]